MPSHRNIVGPQVMRIRNAKSMSQADLAVACQLIGWDVSRGVIARIEGRVKWVSDGELLQLAKALKVSVPELFPKSAQRWFAQR